MDDDISSSEDDKPPPKARNSRYDVYCRAKNRCFEGVWYRLYAIAPDGVEATRIKNSIKKKSGEHVRVIRENGDFLVYYGDEMMFRR